MRKPKVLHKYLNLVVVILAFVACITLSACAPHSVTTEEGYSLLAEDELTIITSLDNPPFEYYEGSDPTGYGIAVAKAVAETMGLEPVIRNADASNHEEGIQLCISALEDGKADISVASFTAAGLQQADVDYTIPYYEANQTIVIKTGAYDNRGELIAEDIHIGVIENSPSQDYGETAFPEQLYTYRNADAARDALMSGDVDALILDSHQATRLIQQSGGALSNLEQIIMADRFVIAVSRIDGGLADAISNVIATMQMDGTLERLQDQCL